MASRSSRSLRLFKWLLGVSLAALTAGVLVVGVVYLSISRDLPDIEQLRDIELQEPLRVYTRDGELLAVYGAKRRIPLSLDEIPEPMIQAFIAAEDERFYRHPGVDAVGLARATWNLVTTGRKTQGGSTITMQLARNFFLTRERTYIRKLREIVLALEIERELDKDEILELYLNKIFLGHRAYGVGAAAQIYYGREVGELTLAETALIAGLPTAPSRYNPISSPRHALGRRDYVLRRMHLLGMIDDEQAAAARAEPDTAGMHAAPVAAEAAYIGEMARLEAAERFGENVYTGGYRVYTTVTAERQQAAVDALREQLLAYERRQGYRGAAGRIDSEYLPDTEVLRERIETPEVDIVADDEGTVHVIERAEDELLGPYDLDDRLGGHPRYGELEPAVVIEVGDEEVHVYRRRGRLDPMPFAGMEWARARGENGPVGDSPERPADVVERGEIVYVIERGGVLALAHAPEVQGAIVAVDPGNGAIRALMGGYDFHRSKFNRVTQGRRQPGSAFKPFVFSAALDRDYHAATMVNDAPVVFDDPALEDTWRPENYGGRIFGPTRLREGLVHSRNLVSIRVLLDIGIPYTTRYIERFGFPRDNLPHDLTLALGSGSVTPLQMATGYAVFANGGYRVEPYLVERIEDSRGDIHYRANPARVCPDPCELVEQESERIVGGLRGIDFAVEADAVAGDTDAPRELTDIGVPDRDEIPEVRIAERVIDGRTAYIISSMMRDVARRGTGARTRQLGRDDLAGKTGTTDDQLDAWFVGYQPSLVSSVWVGHDQLRPLGRNETGARAALPIWIDFMGRALNGVEEYWPDLPGGMVTVRIDPDTGELSRGEAGNAMFEVFREEDAPQRSENDAYEEDEAETLF